MSASTITTVDARNQFSDILNRAAYGGEHVVLTRRGKAVAALIPVDHLRLLEQIIERLEDRIDLEAALRVLDDESDEVLDWDEVARDL